MKGLDVFISLNSYVYAVTLIVRIKLSLIWESLAFNIPFSVFKIFCIEWLCEPSVESISKVVFNHGKFLCLQSKSIEKKINFSQVYRDIFGVLLAYHGISWYIFEVLYFTSLERNSKCLLQLVFLLHLGI